MVTIAAKDPRDAAFFAYWTTVIDMTDPAAPHWMDHHVRRVEECRALVDKIARFRPLAGLRALDVGCQTGAMAIALGERGADVTGVDIAEFLLEAARRRTAGWKIGAEFLVARGEALPFDDATFDVVTFTDVIEHCDDADACLREVARVLRPGGIAFVLGPNRFAPEWFLRDPHYQLAGASVLPRGLGRRYVEWRRGRPGYDVGVFPIGTHVARVLARAHMALLDSPVHAADRWFRSHTPPALHALAPIARAWGHVRLAAVPLFEIVARKRGSSADRTMSESA